LDLAALYSDHFTYCLDQLKRFDHDRYLAILLTPERHRAALCALYAFQTEMARIPVTVSEPMLGEIRFQWWRETLEGLTPGSIPGHEIACALVETLFETEIIPADLVSVVDAHAAYLADEPFASISDIEKYVERRDGTLLSLALKMMGDDFAHNKGIELEKLGMAYGLIQHIRSFPFWASRQQLSLPLDLMAKHEIDPHDIFSGTHRPGIDRALNDLIDHAAGFYEEGRAARFQNAPEVLANMLPCSLVPLYILQLRGVAADPFQRSSDIAAFRRQIRYLGVRWRKRF
jgi:15-cis-phytoene synthase